MVWCVGGMLYCCLVVDAKTDQRGGGHVVSRVLECTASSVQFRIEYGHVAREGD